MADKPNPDALTDMDDDIFDPAAVIETAKRSLAVLDRKLVDAQMRRDDANTEIRTLRAQKEQMARIASAGDKRTVNRTPKPAASFTPPS